MAKAKKQESALDNPVAKFALLEGYFTLIEEVSLPQLKEKLQEIDDALEEIRKACEDGNKLADELEEDLGVYEEAGAK